MKNRWVTIVLALVIALQSLAAIGDTNQPHYSTTLHHDHEHSQEVAVIDFSALGTESSSFLSDSSPDHSSDHSYQNHAHFHVVLVSAATDIAVLSAGQRLSDYQASHTSVIPPSLFRPPIA
jgi:lipopolysaccharide export system protein LptC